MHAGGGVVQAAGALLLLAPLALVGEEAEDGEADAGDDEREAERHGAAGVPQAARGHAPLAPEVCHQPGDQLLQRTGDIAAISLIRYWEQVCICVSFSCKSLIFPGPDVGRRGHLDLGVRLGREEGGHQAQDVGHAAEGGPLAGRGRGGGRRHQAVLR